MIRLALILVAGALVWAAWAAHRTAVAAEALRDSIAYAHTAWPPPAIDGRGGDHLWQVNILALDAAKGKTLTDAQAHSLNTLGAIDDMWIQAGRAGDRLKAIRGAQ